VTDGDWLTTSVLPPAWQWSGTLPAGSRHHHAALRLREDPKLVKYQSNADQMRMVKLEIQIKNRSNTATAKCIGNTGAARRQAKC
jgi:hypothetical protein